MNKKKLKKIVEESTEQYKDTLIKLGKETPLPKAKKRKPIDLKKFERIAKAIRPSCVQCDRPQEKVSSFGVCKKPECPNFKLLQLYE